CNRRSSAARCFPELPIPSVVARSMRYGRRGEVAAHLVKHGQLQGCQLRVVLAQYTDRVGEPFLHLILLGTAHAAAMHLAEQSIARPVELRRLVTSSQC
ncbi:MAG: hypothetical protein R3322_20550, partial [Kiloniellales bacterium]|nr:hypothetical protein [Kiloniellales bacterium]